MGSYAQTNIDAGKAGTFKRGDEVSGLDDKELKQLKETGAIGDKPPPDDDDAPKPGEPNKPAPEPAGLPGAQPVPVSPPREQPPHVEQKRR